jgi:hypothetical protein
MNYESAAAKLTGRCETRRKVASNTYLERRGDDIALRLHNTDVLMFHPNEDVTLDTDGRLTITTKQRINEYLPRGWRVWSDRGVWYLLHTPVDNLDYRKYPYADGMVIHSDGTVTGEGGDPKAKLKLKRKIAAFAKGYMDAFMAGDVPAPSGGDCWICLGTSRMCLGTSRDTDHILSHIVSHIEQRYYVPSLLSRSIERFPVSQAANHCIAAMWSKEVPPEYATMSRIDIMGGFKDIAHEQLQKSLKRYISEQLGMQG